jgi:hypothetical protein
MLQWFVEKKIALAVLDGKQMIEQNEVQISPEKITDAVLDKNIDIHLIRKYFSRDAWQTVIGAVKLKMANCFFTCKCCNHDADESPSVLCELCLCWYHLCCVALKSQPKVRYWYCRSCIGVYNEVVKMRTKSKCQVNYDFNMFTYSNLGLHGPKGLIEVNI